MRQDSELVVITKVKDLIKYVFQISNNAPKKYRFSLISRLQNISMDILENLIIANEIILSADEVQNKDRLNYQHAALAKLKVLDAVAMVAKEQECLLPKQYEVLSRYIVDCSRLTGAWINSDKSRISKFMGI